MGVLLAFPSGDPITDFARNDADFERWLESRPKCTICGNHIQEESCYVIAGKFICEKCMEKFRVNIDG